MRKITIDPITRLEGHGKIVIFLNDRGDVERAYLQIPELRGFEKFSQGRLAEDMPQITSRICGVCPWAHHMAATKALDDLYKVDPPAAAKKIRELAYNVFIFEDHAIHLFYLGGPDLFVGPRAPKAERNILGVIGKVGLEVGKRVIGMRRELRELEALVGGRTINPVMGLPGGVSKALTAEDQKRFQETAARAVEFALFTLQLFKKTLQDNPQYLELIKSEAYTHKTYYMGLVDDRDRVNFYDGQVRVVDPSGKEFAKFRAQDYLEHIAEHVEPWSYTKFSFLKKVGWKGFVDGPDSGILAVAPLGRLNAASGMATPEAQAAYEEFYDFFGERPVHHTLATHWARIVEMIYAGERIKELADDPEITDPKVRLLPTAIPKEGIGVVEAPRGTLIHHYKTDERGVIEEANLIVATQNNSARIAMSVDKAAREVIHGDGQLDEGLLNMVEMAFRAYDPCHACATHALPGQMPLLVEVYDHRGELLRELRRG
ncbi:MAG: Ni/Fe hydrogenase subunit alpha [Candidatus Acetothermia bacterium]|jgi:F420-non-reducing hydrogenase large subunit|nr:Ni/Fe hydrogenase subunit alpha [Candidatus Acetothermia bacterium]MDH7504924.1 Ni/Fe hydrogenase subunit alpha [Candidatus Acetothermia bacterium]